MRIPHHTVYQANSLDSAPLTVMSNSLECAIPYFGQTSTPLQRRAAWPYTASMLKTLQGPVAIYILLGCSTPLYSFIAPLRRSLMRDMLGAQLYPKPGTNVRCFGMLCWTVRHNCAMLFSGPCYAVLLAKRHAMLGAIVRCYSPGGAMLGASGAQVRGQCTARSGEACQGPLYLNPPSAQLASCNTL